MAGRHQDSLRAVLAALAANLGIAATKFMAFAVTGSASLFAESVHSVADSGNQLLLLLGRHRARRAETQEHQFGFGAERYVYAFVVAVVLFVAGAGFSIYEGVRRITHPEELVSPVVAFAVLAVAITLEGFSLRTAIGESNRCRPAPRCSARSSRRSPAARASSAGRDRPRGPGRPGPPRGRAGTVTDTLLTPHHKRMPT